jgi:hypothetical protein
MSRSLPIDNHGYFPRLLSTITLAGYLVELG